MATLNSSKYKQAGRLHRDGKLVQALDLYQKLLRREPDNAQLNHRVGILLRDIGQLQQAVAHLNKAVMLGLQSADIFADLAECMNLAQEPRQGETMARAALTLQDSHLDGLRQLLKSLFMQAKYAEALPFCAQLLVQPALTITDRLQIARIYTATNQYALAAIISNKAKELDSGSVEARVLLSQIYMNVQKWDEAYEEVQQALDMEPHNVALISHKAHILERKGQDEEAFQLVEPLLKDGAIHNVTAIHVYARLAKRFGVLDHAIGLLERLLGSRVLSVGGRSTTLCLLGAAYDTKGHYEKAFTAIAQGNKIRPAFFDDEGHEQYVNAMIDWFTAERCRNLAKAAMATSNDGLQPIFIVGMPRSGTSLTERILARHPQVHGGGELPYIKTLIYEDLPLMLAVGDEFPANLRAMNSKIADEAATVYLEHLAQFVPPGVRHVTDKMPMNFMYLGFMSLLFPQAKFIHCTRDPLATGLSCFFTEFASVSEMGFSQDLELIGRYTARYQRLMAHWKAVLPVPILDISYEQLVSDPRAEINGLLEFCNLPWSDACLRPESTEQNTKTASYNQVRQPINTQSLEKWRHYEHYLEPLKLGLGLKRSDAA